MTRDQGALRPRPPRVRIVGEGTDLTLGSAAATVSSPAGFRNMPDGEVFYSPVEDSAEGVITFAGVPAVYLGHDVVGARLVFREGGVVEASAEEGEEFLSRCSRTDDGRQPPRRARARLQPRGSRASRATSSSTRRSTAPSTSAVGASYTYAGGKNESAVHWDLVEDLRPGGELQRGRRARAARRRAG